MSPLRYTAWMFDHDALSLEDISWAFVEKEPVGNLTRDEVLDNITLTWVTCGHVACCEPSPNRHATAHAGSSGHPIIRSLEPGEDWCWCYEDEVVFRVDLPRADA